MRGSRLVPHWEDEAWQVFRDAWEERGLVYAPSPKQMSILWPIVRDHPDKVATWVEEAPRETSMTYEIVAYVIDAARWERERVSLFQALTDDERQEWRDLEEGDAHYTTIPARLREARLTGAGLTEQPDGTNPYRAFLRQRSEGMAEMLERIESMRLERERATT